MPPKAVNTPAVTGDNFLITCIKNSKEKMSVDFAGVAKDTGMSAGGAANKFRAMMKQFEDDGATWTKSPAKSPTKSPTKSGDAGAAKAKATTPSTPKKSVKTKVEEEASEDEAEAAVENEEESDAESGDGEDNNSDGEHDEPVKKKAKTRDAALPPTLFGRGRGSKGRTRKPAVTTNSGSDAENGGTPGRGHGNDNATTPTKGKKYNVKPPPAVGHGAINPEKGQVMETENGMETNGLENGNGEAQAEAAVANGSAAVEHA